MAQLIIPKAIDASANSRLLPIEFIRPQPIESQQPPPPEEQLLEERLPEPPPAPLPNAVPMTLPEPETVTPERLTELPALNANRQQDWMSDITKPQTTPAAKPVIQPTLKRVQPKPKFDKDLFPISKTEPIYPRRAKRRRIEGWVNVEFTITKEGRTEDIVVLAAEPEGYFESSSLKAVARWKFKPQMLDGKATARRVVQTIEFGL